MWQPKVSIVTPTFNQAHFLPATLRSVQAQEYPQLEHIVVDGASTDGSVDLLRAAPGIRWVSERDRGQVEALNKGFALATGEVLTWLCADDLFHPDTVRQAVGALEQTGADLVYGTGEVVDAQGRFLKRAKVIPFDYRLLLCNRNWIPQPTVFFRRRLWERAGPMREEFDNAFDYELWLRMAPLGRFAYAPAIRAQLRVHPAAKTTARPQVTRRDCREIRRRHWPASGLPGWLARPPWFPLAHGYYRALRLWRWVRAGRQGADAT
jgi:glycosyltransferase involved in cell wall biosynthesis